MCVLYSLILLYLCPCWPLFIPLLYPVTHTLPSPRAVVRHVTFGSPLFWRSWTFWLLQLILPRHVVWFVTYRATPFILVHVLVLVGYNVRWTGCPFPITGCHATWHLCYGVYVFPVRVWHGLVLRPTVPCTRIHCTAVAILPFLLPGSYRSFLAPLPADNTFISVDPHSATHVLRLHTVTLWPPRLVTGWLPLPRTVPFQRVVLTFDTVLCLLIYLFLRCHLPTRLTFTFRLLTRTFTFTYTVVGWHILVYTGFTLTHCWVPHHVFQH